jgi:uncharacterized protein YdaU (DUF1376 family)
MSNTPFMQLYVGDYLADTLDLSCEEHGAYMLLLMTMWRHGAKLPNDHTKLARVARLSPRKWAQVWSEIGRFFDDNGTHISNPRLSKEYRKAEEKSEIRSEAGRKGGAAKALKDNNAALANATVLPCHSSEPEPEVRKREANASHKSKGARLSQDWILPKQWGEWALAEGWTDEDIRAQAARFRDYWVAIPGQRGVKLDWLATWRNWMRDKPKSNQLKAINGGRNDQPSSKSETRLNAFVSGARGAS